MKNIKQVGLFLCAVVLLFNSGCKTQSAVSYLALGDSYTIGESVDQNQRWPVQLVEALQDSGIQISGPRIIAKTGWTTLDLKEAIADADLNPPYKLVSLLIGVNDQYDGLDFTKYPGRFEFLVKKSVELTGGNPDHVLVVSIPDYSVTPFGQKKDPNKIARDLAQYNATNKSIADSLGVHYVDITPGSKKAISDQSLTAGDGLHPSVKMYSQWVQKVVPVILPQLRK
jgi:lysophospholipase L1-like esterase